MWILIVLLIIVGIIIIKFLIDRGSQSSIIKQQGGMKNKYRELIQALMMDPRTKIFNESPDSISLGLSNMGGTTLFILTQTFGFVTVQWKVDSPVFGKHKMEWDFPENQDQRKMVEKIENDLGDYQRRIFRT